MKIFGKECRLRNHSKDRHWTVDVCLKLLEEEEVNSVTATEWRNEIIDGAS